MVEKASISFERCCNELEAFQIGPLGDQKGREWSFISKGAITEIIITCDGYAVVSFDFKGVEEHGNVEYSDTFGRHYEEVYKIKLDFPEEYFTSLSGTYYRGAVAYYFSSLCFHTNRQKYGPYGYVVGTPFEFPMKGRVIVGFYGRVLTEEAWIHGTLGVYVKHSTDLLGPNSSQAQAVKPNTKVIRSIFNQEECIKVGPWGWSRSSTEEEWSYMLKGATKIKIGYNEESIKWISFESSGENGEVKHSQKSDISNERHEVISLNWPEEYLVSISMTLRDTIKDIESLCFYTNRTIYGPFGLTKSRNPFRFYMKGGIIVGFHGRVGDYFDALGVYIKPFPEVFSSSGQGQIENTEVKAGTFGGQGGKEWNYKQNGAITEIKICHGRVIHSLSFKSVDKNGKSTYSDRFGGEGGDTDLITIFWPREYLISISGTHHTHKKQHVVESLCFHTNKKKYGPFGGTQGSHFDIPLKDQDIVGFHGRASNYIDAIGVYQ
ncbi:hypothetical protein Ddye_012738 [Dipteronia dyeriana]|uniref:Jacalin-type lectin domain-containing protein n=1 Tax=Dipteronia dyeriana TaxID=168575 RepID=A0AAD9X548_9ROSI|nr:hypothetical protein Ddye_012738 [Dipteronia dyeriana]